jgi:GR25 family glycosyltransferase involved in LPS biosynthesis
MTETDNSFVSSRGLLKSSDYYSLTPNSSIKYLYGYPEIEILDKITTPIIYVCSSAIPHFINNTLNLINKKFILVSGDCDEDIPFDIFSNNNDFLNFINNEKIIHWFCQNWKGDHNKVSIIPIGLDYHTMTTKNSFWGPIMSPNEQEQELIKINNNSKMLYEREIKCYSNFHFFMTSKYGNDRQMAVNEIPKELVHYESVRVERNKSWETQAKYAFVLSPHGNGLDCHRTWEALALGCIPIVKKSPIDKLYKELPVLIVNEWKDVSQKLLEETVINFQKMKFNYERLTLKYWLNKINLFKTNIIICGCVRNCSEYLDEVFKNIEKMKEEFNIIEIVLAYDNSDDNTLLKLFDLVQKHKIKILLNDKPVLKDEPMKNVRVINICNARNRIMDYINKSYNDIKIDYFIMMDFDEVCSKAININALITAFDIKDNWDSITFNNKRYYDYWALSFENYIYSCWHTTNPLKTIEYMHDALKEKFDKTDKYIECDSAFNGFGIYNYEKFKKYRYDTKIDNSMYQIDKLYNMVIDKDIKLIKNDLPDCEHRIFHMNAKKDGCKIVILKDFLFPEYNGKHIVSLPKIQNLMNDIKIYIIHYTPLKDRKDNIIKQFKNHNLNKYEIIETFDREVLEEKDINKFSNIKLSEISLFLKHNEIFKKEDNKIVVVFEDDSILVNNFSEILKKHLEELEKIEWDIIFCSESCNLHKNKIGNKIIYDSDTSRGTGMYIMNKGVASKLKNIFELENNINKPIDHWFNDMKIKYNLKYLWSEPTIVHQGSEMGIFKSELR